MNKAAKNRAIWILCSSIALLSLQNCQNAQQLFADSQGQTPGLAERLQNDGWDVTRLDSAREAPYLSEQEKDVVLAHNAVRSNPKKFAKLYVKEIRRYYTRNILRYPGEIPIQTQEGIRAADELYQFLLKQRPLPLLQVSKGMSQAAADHARDQATSGRLGHSGSDGSLPFIRMNRYGKWGKTAGENISYGEDDGLRIVLQLLIDDGVPARGHRGNILKAGFHVIGVAIDKHPQYRFSCTIDYTGAYREK